QLDDAIADRADIHGAFGENGIVAIRLEHALFQRLVVVFGLEFVLFDVLEFLGLFTFRVRAAQRLLASSRATTTQLARDTADPSRPTSSDPSASDSCRPLSPLRLTALCRTSSRPCARAEPSASSPTATALRWPFCGTRPRTCSRPLSVVCGQTRRSASARRST